MHHELSSLPKLGVSVPPLNIVIGTDTLGQNLSIFKIVHVLEVLFDGGDHGAERRVSVEAQVVGACAVAGSLTVRGLQQDALGRTVGTSHVDLGALRAVRHISSLDIGVSMACVAADGEFDVFFGTKDEVLVALLLEGVHHDFSC